MSSALVQTSVYHWAKSSSMEVMALTAFFSFAISRVPSFIEK